MKNGMVIILCCFMMSLSWDASAQKDHGDLYSPTADASNDIDKLVAQAKEEGKHVILQVGGNWCVWCYKFHNYIGETEKVKEVVENNFLIYHLNYSKENKNEAILAKYRFPQRFGFPVFVVLDGEGNILHTQDSALLESGEGYDEKKVMGFFNSWTLTALDPATYVPKE